MKYPFGFLILLLSLHVTGQNNQYGGGRQVLNINKGWTFCKSPSGEIPGNNAGWQKIDLPHTWNVADVMDDEPGYYRGVGCYRKTISLPNNLRGKQISFYFEGANQKTKIYVNGKLASTHIGGYTGFSIVVTPFLQFDGASNNNLLEVLVDNSFDASIPPLNADFTFYGGIYRDVFIIATDPIHFANKEYGSKGIFVTTPLVTTDHATINVRSTLVNDGSNARLITIRTTIADRSGKEIAKAESFTPCVAGKSYEFKQELSVSGQKLWSPEDPYCYVVSTKIIDRSSGRILDELQNPLGFRWFSFDANNGFFLNGKSYRLVGASRHQDKQGWGNALPDSIARRDVLLLKQMGANFLRVAHYPQDPAILQACDELGMLASVEIPVVNEITETDSFYNNSINMQVEMIRQNFNHPSVIVWCYMNEVLLRAHFNDDKTRQKIYFESIRRLAASLDSVTRKEDPSRYTMLVNHGDFDKYRNAGLLEIPMIVGWNLYSGWYGPNLEDFPAFLDEFHAKYPSTPMMVTEYGADADPRIHSLNPVRFDKSIEYSVIFHRYYMKEMRKRPFVAAAVAWNLADFNSETRNETMPHINNKGLMKWDRTPKDPYFLYQALLTKNPFLKILQHDWRERTVIADSASENRTVPVQVVTNLDSIELFVDGKSFGWQIPDGGLASWNAPFHPGRNRISVNGVAALERMRDNVVVDYNLIPWQWNSNATAFPDLNILMGAKRYFTDPVTNESWIPDQPYHPGSFGSTGGKEFRITGNGRLPYGTDKNILGTFNDPIYQTQRTGIDNYKLDLPAGNYQVTLHFAELVGGNVKGLVYDLASGDRKEEITQRVFDVYINDRLVLSKFSVPAENGNPVAVAKQFIVKVNKNEGMTIQFKAISGEPVLNALQVKRLSSAVSN